MSFVNHATREINVRILYGGPESGGEKTNLRLIHLYAEGGSPGPCAHRYGEARLAERRP